MSGSTPLAPDKKPHAFHRAKRNVNIAEPGDQQLSLI